jgi:hypothetical protein
VECTDGVGCLKQLYTILLLLRGGSTSVLLTLELRPSPRVTFVLRAFGQGFANNVNAKKGPCTNFRDMFS